jgi:rhodanese-related sulfurtransferase
MPVTRRIPPVVKAQELAELVRAQPDIRLLDVRTPGEYGSVHIPGAYNVPLATLGEHAEELRATVDEPVVLICQSGTRAKRGEEALKACTMTNLPLLEGGMNGWIAAGALAATGAALALLVEPLWSVLPAVVGSGLIFAGLTDTCGMAMLLSKLPCNRPATCDVEQMVAALKRGSGPTGIGRVSPASTPTARSCTN